MTDATALRTALEAMGLPRPDGQELPDSPHRFPDGSRYRIEIPSTEGPDMLEEAVREAARLDVPIHRYSQGSGVLMTTDAELDRWAQIAFEEGVEVSLFARPNAGWDASAASTSEGGAGLAPTARGQEQLFTVLSDVQRAANAGIRSVLVGDVGVLKLVGALRTAGVLPSDMQAKVSVMLPVANPATAQLIVDLGAATINLPTDLTLRHIAEIRRVVSVPLDIYVEAPSNLGGFVRFHEIAELVRVAAPVYIKFGLRNGPDIYPWGRHLATVARDMTLERVRRARLGLEALIRLGVEPPLEVARSKGLAVPVMERASLQESQKENPREPPRP